MYESRNCKLETPKRKNLRQECNCLMGNDIGAYNTCGHLCKYCYANANKGLVIENMKKHNEKNKEINILEDLLRIINQYFPELINKFEDLTDVRNQSYVKYKMKVIFIVRLMTLMCEIKRMTYFTY